MSKTKLAHIVPTSCLPALSARSGVTTHLALANLVVSNPTYQAYYRNMRMRGHTVILDNPVHEDMPVRFSTWLHAISILQPQVAILPDVIDSAEGTLDNASSVAVTIRQVLGAMEAQPRFMAVPHGITQTEWLECARTLVKMSLVSYIGISLERRLNDDEAAFERRNERLQMFWKMLDEESIPYVPVHFLGISEAAGEFLTPICETVHTADASKFAVWNLVGKPQHPPAPINDIYPGRAGLGGDSMAYFYWPGLPPDGFADNLAQWSAYANTQRKRNSK